MMMERTPIANLRRRLGRMGISVEFIANIPWIYLTKINGDPVTEKFHSEHGFTVAFYPAMIGSHMTLTETKVIFDLIRKYTNTVKINKNENKN